MNKNSQKIVLLPLRRFEAFSHKASWVSFWLVFTYELVLIQLWTKLPSLLTLPLTTPGLYRPFPQLEWFASSSWRLPASESMPIFHIAHLIASAIELHILVFRFPFDRRKMFLFSMHHLANTILVAVNASHLLHLPTATAIAVNVVLLLVLLLLASSFGAFRFGRFTPVLLSYNPDLARVLFVALFTLPVYGELFYTFFVTAFHGTDFMCWAVSGVVFTLLVNTALIVPTLDKQQHGKKA